MEKEMTDEEAAIYFKRAAKLMDKIERMTLDERQFLASALLLNIADEMDATIRETGMAFITFGEEHWSSLGEDISKPPRRGSGNG